MKQKTRNELNIILIEIICKNINSIIEFLNIEYGLKSMVKNEILAMDDDEFNGIFYNYTK